MEVRGFPRCFSSMEWFGTPSGTLRSASISSEKVMSCEGSPERVSKARLTMEDRRTSAKVPRWGSPEGPYPVWKVIISFFVLRDLSREMRTRASWKGQDLA